MGHTCSRLFKILLTTYKDQFRRCKQFQQKSDKCHRIIDLSLEYEGFPFACNSDRSMFKINEYLSISLHKFCNHKVDDYPVIKLQKWRTDISYTIIRRKLSKDTLESIQIYYNDNFLFIMINFTSNHKQTFFTISSCVRNMAQTYETCRINDHLNRLKTNRRQS